MSFWPFPTSLLAEFRHGAARGPVVELGAGTGDLARRLADAGLDVVTLDRDLRLDVDVIADGRQLPFADGRLGLVVMADVLRHATPLVRAELAIACTSAIAPGGRVVVLEDHPEARDRAEANYRDVLALLADEVPGRGPARRIDGLTAALRERLGAPVAAGEEENVVPVDDPLEPVRWMRRVTGNRRDLRARLEDLAATIEDDGMRYGRYCFEVYAGDEH